MMRKIHLVRSQLVTGGIAVLAFIAITGAGFAVGAFALGGGGSGTASHAEEGETISFSRNDSGQTYGPGFDVPFDQRPDLMEVGTSDGQLGYIYRDEFDEATGAHVSTPEEAVAWEKSKSTRDMVSSLPIYEADGKTQIGDFPITASIPMGQ